MRLDFGNWLTIIFVLIFAYLVLTHWTGANALLTTGTTGGGAIIKDLQGR